MIVRATAPARIDLAGGTLDLWPLHVLHPGSVTVNVAIDRRAVCEVRETADRFVVSSPAAEWKIASEDTAGLLGDPHTALAGALLQALEIDRPLEIQITSAVPYGSGLGGSSALCVAMLGALERWSAVDLSGVDRVGFVRDVETAVLGKPAGVQDYYPPFDAGVHRIWFHAGETRADRVDPEPDEWDRHLTLYDTGVSHSSGMNNWEVFRGRLEGDRSVAEHLEGVRRAARDMADAVRDGGRPDFSRMGRALDAEWQARRRLAPVVSTPEIEAAVGRARNAGAWAGKACGAGGGGCVVFLSPPDRTAAVRRALAAEGSGSVLPVRVETRGLSLEASEA
jgi:D-glycero-alpha-D-manno-heptose-7-phosphate kinase